MRIEINEKTGAVTINGELCAEVLVGTGEVIATRDDIQREIGDRRALKALRSRVIDAIRGLNTGFYADHNYKSADLSAAAFGRGILNGISRKKEIHPINGEPMLPDYSKGGKAGYDLGAFLIRIVDIFKEETDGSGSAEGIGGAQSRIG